MPKIRTHDMVKTRIKYVEDPPKHLQVTYILPKNIRPEAIQIIVDQLNQYN